MEHTHLAYGRSSFFLARARDTFGKRAGVRLCNRRRTPMAAADCRVADVFACLGWCGALRLAGATHRCARGVERGSTRSPAVRTKTIARFGGWFSTSGLAAYCG